MSSNATRDAILKYWFGEDMKTSNDELWWSGTPDIDNEIRDKFSADVDKAIAGEYDHWAVEPLGAMALIILLDQFALNIFRDQPKSFETSARAVPWAYTTIARGFDGKVPEAMRMFIYMPLMHSELLIDQDNCVRIFREAGMNADFAVVHRDIVAKYGRFPGRNAVFGRESTAEEVKYLADGWIF